MFSIKEKVSIQELDEILKDQNVLKKDLESKVTEMLPKIQKIDQMVSISNN